MHVDLPFHGALERAVRSSYATAWKPLCLETALPNTLPHYFQIHPNTNFHGNNATRFFARTQSEWPRAEFPMESWLPFGTSDLSPFCLHPSRPSGLPHSYQNGPFKLCSVFRSFSSPQPQALPRSSGKSVPENHIGSFSQQCPYFLGPPFSLSEVKGLSWLAVPRILSMMEGRPGSWSLCIQGQEAESKECWCSACCLLPVQCWTPAHGMGPPIFRVCFPTT